MSNWSHFAPRRPVYRNRDTFRHPDVAPPQRWPAGYGPCAGCARTIDQSLVKTCDACRVSQATQKEVS